MASGSRSSSPTGREPRARDDRSDVRRIASAARLEDDLQGAHSMRPLFPLAIGALAGAILLVPHAASARALLEDLPLIGTGGGTAFSRTCPSGHVLTGVRWRTGAVVDG